VSQNEFLPIFKFGLAHHKHRPNASNCSSRGAKSTLAHCW